MRGTKMLSDSLHKYGVSQEGVNKSLAAYNQGRRHVSRAIDHYGNNWVDHIKEEGRKYITYVNSIRNNAQKIPGYFGENR